jgi:hypothetical protein
VICVIIDVKKNMLFSFFQIINPQLADRFQDILPSGGTGWDFFNIVIPDLITLALVLGVVAFFFLLVAGGLQWITSSGNKASVEAARAKITAALIGLGLLFSVFVGVRVVNSLFDVNIGGLGSMQQEEVEIQPPEGGFEGLRDVDFQRIVSYGIQLVLVVASIAFFFMLIAGGMNWITSGGDKMKVQTARKQITNALIGLLIVFSVFTVIMVIEVLFNVSILEGIGPGAPPSEGGAVITIRASGTEDGGVYPDMQLLIDDSVVATYTVTGTMTDYEYQYDSALTDASRIKVRFINDSGPRNLRVDHISIDGVIYESEASTTYSTGTWSSGTGTCADRFAQSEWLHCNGYFHYLSSSIPIPNSPNCTITPDGTQTVSVGDTVTYDVNCSDDSAFDWTAIYWQSTTGQGKDDWIEINTCLSSSTCSGSVTWDTAGEYYVAAVSAASDESKCSANPWCVEWSPVPPNGDTLTCRTNRDDDDLEGWEDCTANDLATVTVSDSAGSVGLEVGWNMISIPMIPNDSDPGQVFSSLGGNYTEVTYEGCGETLTYDPNNPSGSSLTTIDEKHGYWINMSNQDTLVVSGTVPSSTTIPLCTGWNMIGYPLLTAMPIEEVLAQIEGKYNLVYYYDASDLSDHWKRYAPGVPVGNDLSEMKPWHGYQIDMTEPAELIIPPPAPSCPTSTSFTVSPGLYHNLTADITNGDTNTVTLTGIFYSFFGGVGDVEAFRFGGVKIWQGSKSSVDVIDESEFDDFYSHSINPGQTVGVGFDFSSNDPDDTPGVVEYSATFYFDNGCSITIEDN